MPPFPSLGEGDIPTFYAKDFQLIALIRPNIIFVKLPVILASISSSKSSLASAESLLKLNNV